MKVASVSEIRQIEASADRSLLSYAQMMRNAGAEASAFLRGRASISEASRLLFLIGKGNNGGDGLVMALELARAAPCQISLYLLAPRDADDPHFEAAAQAGFAIFTATEDESFRALERLLGEADILVDALFGIGMRLPLREDAAALMRRAAIALRSRASRFASDQSSGGPPFVLALDCPSGVDCDAGQAAPEAIAADATITFIAAKLGFYLFPAAAYLGELVLTTIGIPANFSPLHSLASEVLDGSLARALLPARPMNSHKGTFGKAMIVAGSANYIGAASLAGEAACRSGAGLVTVATIQGLVDSVAAHLREATWLPLPEDAGGIGQAASDALLASLPGYRALLIGCGLGTRPGTSLFLRRLLASDQLPPLILDADALNLLSKTPKWHESLPADAIITPHIGEMARLTGLSSQAINAERWDLARRCAKAWNVVLLLKGAHTLIAAPDGRTSVIPIATDALATAGTGDVLAGLLAGLRAQGMAAYDCARLGAFIHARAGQIASDAVGSSRSVIAGDVLASLGAAFRSIEAD